MSAGLLWLASLVLLLAPVRNKLLTDTEQAKAISDLAASWPTPVVVPAALAIAYVLGSVMIVLSSSLMRVVGQRILNATSRLASYGVNNRTGVVRNPKALFRTAQRLSRAWSPISLTARGFIFDAQLNSFIKVGVPGISAITYPVEPALSTLGHSAAQLAITAPALYQEYDRLRSEAEFRLGCAPPLAFLATVAPLNYKPWIITAVVTGCLVLILQAVTQTQSANDILANSAYLGHISIQTVEGLAEAIKQMTPVPNTEGGWIAAIIVAMERRAQYEEKDAVIAELKEFNPVTLSEALRYLDFADEHTLLVQLAHSLDPENPEHAEALSTVDRKLPPRQVGPVEQEELELDQDRV
ncbi:hypothetical protein C8E86_2795 [Catellatospora citrea]|nr:hypothetical protein C8E86_2795 [Catellatospora citrea]